jgi:putative transposase
MENYWDRCISLERSYWARLNYINHNPVKHGYVTDARAYPFGSYYFESRESWEVCEREYPWDSVSEEDDF